MIFYVYIQIRLFYVSVKNKSDKINRKVYKDVSPEIDKRKLGNLNL